PDVFDKPAARLRGARAALPAGGCIQTAAHARRQPFALPRRTPRPHSPVQNDASALLYISQIWLYLMGNSTKRSLFSSSRGSRMSAHGEGNSAVEFGAQ